MCSGNCPSQYTYRTIAVLLPHFLEYLTIVPQIALSNLQIDAMQCDNVVAKSETH